MLLPPNLQLCTPIQLVDSNFQDKDVKLLIKRDDLIHPWINGNKWRKLQGHIDHYKSLNYKGIITYGGANSNHLVAVACACKELKIPSVGLVRTYGIDEFNPIVQKLRDWEMELIAVLPKAYKEKEGSEDVQKVLSDYPNHMVIPEGGTSQYAMPGLEMLANEIIEDPLYTSELEMILSIGTGGMLSGLYNALPRRHKFTVACPFKSDLTRVEGMDLITDIDTDRIRFKNTSGGKRFGAYDIMAVRTINKFYSSYGVLLDPIYTAKAVKWLIDEITNGDSYAGRSILMIHSGGLPGILAYNYMNRKKVELIDIPSGYDHLQYAATTRGKK